MKTEILVFIAINAVLSIILTLSYLYFIKNIFDIQLILALMSIFFIFMIISYIFLNKKFSALHCLIGFASSYSKKYSEIPVCDGSYEVKNLRDAILELVDTNEYLCKQKQELFKEAAHELKSPIAVLKARLSLFEQQKQASKKDFIDEAKQDIVIITSKLKELLFLKSIEWDMQLKREYLNMEDNYKLMQKVFRPILEKKNIKVNSSWQDNFIIFTYKEAMQKVIQAIFENIFIHTEAGSTIKVNAKPNVINIKNEIDTKNETALFSSYIGIKMIQRLSGKLSYDYSTFKDEKYFYTKLTLYNQDEDNCPI